MKQRWFSPKGLTERFLKDSFHVTKYSSYLKTVMAGSDQYKSKTAISGLPCTCFCYVFLRLMKKMIISHENIRIYNDIHV